MKLIGAQLSIQLNGTSLFLSLRGSREQIEERFMSLDNGGFVATKLHWASDETAYVWITKGNLINYLIHVQAAQIWTKHQIIMEESPTWRAKAKLEALAYFEAMPRAGFHRAPAMRRLVEFGEGVMDGMSCFKGDLCEA